MRHDLRTSSPAPGRESVHAPVLGQAVKFGLVGLATLLIDYSTYRGLLALGAPVSASKACGFVLGTTAAYLINRTFTFGHGGGRRAVLSFIGLYAVTLVLNVAVNGVALHLLDGASGGITIAFLVAQAVTSTANFLGMRYVVFHPGRPGHTDAG